MTKKIGLALLIVLIYIVVWRPGRGLVMQEAVKPAILQTIKANELDIAFEYPSRVSIIVTYKNLPEPTSYRFKIPAGLFFLLGFAGLVLADSPRFYYYLLIGLQIVGGLLAFLCFILGLLGFQAGFYAADFFQVYLIPFASLALVPLVILGQKKVVFISSGANTA